MNDIYIYIYDLLSNIREYYGLVWCWIGSSRALEPLAPRAAMQRYEGLAEGFWVDMKTRQHKSNNNNGLSMENGDL